MNKLYLTIILAGLAVLLPLHATAATDPAVIKAPGNASTPAVMTVPPKDLLSKELTNMEIEKWRKHTAENPKDPNGFFELAMAYSRSSYIEKAWPALQEVDKLDPAFANKTIQKMAANLAKNPMDAESRYKLAFGYYFNGLKNNDNASKQKAKDEFDMLISQYPNNVWAINYRAYLYTEDGNLDKGIQMWEQSMKIDPKNPVTHFVLGHAYYKKGKFRQALFEIGKAFELRNQGN